ncbi:MAG: SLC13 family permease [Candidatus Sumerlaeia bacterium]|nr:SLC13 family permease [Candidatus Sumerlaeia bacterium]
MSIEGWITIATIAAVFGGLAFSRLGPDLILLAGAMALVLVGVLTPEQGLAGFSNTGLATIAVLYVVAAGIRETGAISYLVDAVLRRPRSVQSAQLRVMLPVAAISAFMNNTPIVAVMVPALTEWAKKTGMQVSRLMIPLSYAAIVGGTCTLIGTSTNLLVDGMVRTANIPGFERIGFFEISRVGIPLAFIAIGFIVAFQHWLLPDRTPPARMPTDPREYVLEMLVEEGSTLVGRSIEEAGLRHLQGVYLMEIEREGEILPAVSPQMRLHADDRLIFVGIVDSVVDLQKIRGLKPATNQTFKLDAPDARRALFEAVVSNSSPIVGKSIREGRFRTRYDAAIIAVARNGERIRMKIGDIIIQPGDTLMLEAHPEFLDRMRHSRDFYLISRIRQYTPPRYDRAWLAITVLAGMVLSAAILHVSLLKAGMVAAGLMIATKCCTMEAARRSLDWRLLLAIGAALGLGKAMETSGAASTIAQGLIQFAGSNPFLALAIVYLTTTFFTEIVTNNAAAVLVLPIAIATALGLEVSPRPYVFAVMFAASASFITPIGYQTNLMVYGPGGYRFTDFLRIGLPTNVVVFVTAMLLLPRMFPF